MIEPDTEQAKPWDPLGTLGAALWLCGGQWAGKTTVARTLADRYGLVAYHYDYHDARTHTDRLVAEDAVRTAEKLGIRVLWTDGSLAADAVADVVADHWAPDLADERTAADLARHVQPR